MTTAIQPFATTQLGTRADDLGRLAFTPEQERMILDTCAKGCRPDEFAVLMEVARVRRLNPLLKQIHFVKRWDKKLNREVWSHQASIDGLRAIAERTGEYDGSDEPEYEYDGEKLRSARVRVYRKGRSHAFAARCYFSEYVQTTKDGNPTSFWQRMPHVMLGKCAEAAALRKAFPEDMSGMYVPEEMGKDAAEVEAVHVAPQPLEDGASRRAAALVAEVEQRVRADMVEVLDAEPSEPPRTPGPKAIGEVLKDSMPAEASGLILAIACAPTRADLNRLGKDIRNLPADLQAQAREAFNARSVELRSL